MNDIEIDTSTDAKLAEMERRLQTLEVKVAALPDAQELETRITERVKANMPPPIDPSEAPSFRDISLPMPNVQTIVATARTTWMVFELVKELKLLFWTLLDRRYHMAWITRAITLVLLAAVLTSQFWLPFAFDNIVGRTWEKVIDILIGLVMFLVLHYEMRRYQEWRNTRR
jgi:hypothetical protein